MFSDHKVVACHKLNLLVRGVQINFLFFFTLRSSQTFSLNTNCVSSKFQLWSCEYIDGILRIFSHG